MIVLLAGATDTSIDVQIVDDSGLPVTGLNAAAFPTVKYSKGSGNDATISLSDLSALTDAHSDGGVFERGEGVYRLDLPDAVASTVAPKVTVRGEATDKRLICPAIQVASATRGLSGTALPAAAADAAGGLPISDAGGLDLDNRMPSATSITNLNTVFATDFAANYDTTGDCWLARLDDGVTHGGTTATLRLGTSGSTPALYVTNGNGTAVSFAATGGDGIGLSCTASGSDTAGIYAEGGVSGHGISAIGGSSAGAGLGLASVADSWAALYLTAAGLNGIGIAAPQGYGTLPAAIVDEWESQSQADPTGFHVNVLEIEGSDATNQIRDAVVDDATRIDASALNTLSSHDPGATLGTSTLTQTQVTGGAYALNSASFAFNAALDLTTTQKASVNTEADTALSDYDPPTKAELDAAVANVSVDEIQATALADLFNTDSGTTYASAVAGSVVKEIADNAGGSALTAEAIADAVLDEALSGHTTAGTLGKAIADIESDATAILADTNELQADWTNGGRLDLIVDAILVDTAEIGAAGAGLTEAGGTGDHLTAVPWNAAWDAEVQSEVQDAIEANNLDHLLKIAVDTNFATTVHLDSVIGHLADNGTTATFDRTTDSLEALRDRGDAAWITATGFSTHSAADVVAALGTGTTLTAIPWNADWDAEVQSEVADALAAYDPPTNAEMEARTLAAASYATAANQTTIAGYLDTEIAAIITHLTDIKGATFDGSTDSLESIRNQGDAAWITATGFSTLDAAGVRTAIGLASANLDTQLADLPTVAEFEARTLAAADYATATALATVDDFLDTEIAAIKAKTDNLPSDPADASDIAASFSTVNTTLGTIAGYLDTEVAAIKAKTDQLVFTTAGQVDATAVTVGDKTGYALTSGERDSIATAALDLANGVESGVTLRQAMRAQSAILVGILSGGGTGTEVFKAIAAASGGTTRVTVTADSSGNRSAVALNL